MAERGDGFYREGSGFIKRKTHPFDRRCGDDRGYDRGLCERIIKTRWYKSQCGHPRLHPVIKLFLFPMAEELITAGNTKKEKYESLLPQIHALTEGENDLVANLANISA